MGVFGKWKTSKTPERIREEALIFCLEADPGKVLDRIEAMFPTTRRGDAHIFTLRNNDMEIVLLARGVSEEGENGRFAKEQLEGVCGYVYQNKTALLEVKRGLLYHLRQCKGALRAVCSFDRGTPEEIKEKEAQIRDILLAVTERLRGVVTFGDTLSLLDGQGRLILDREGNSALEFYMPAEIPVPDDWKTSAPKESMERRDRSLALLRDKRIYVTPWLPLLSEQEEDPGRAKEEVCGRAAALLAVALYSECRLGEKMSYEEARDFTATVIDSYGAKAFFTPEERSYLEDPDSAEQTQIQYIWQYENLWVMEWALGLTDDLFWPDRICDVPESVRLMNACPSSKELTAAARLRSRKELLDQADLIYRLHWACVDARVMGLPAPWGLEEGVVMERHRALFWLAGCDGMCPWDEVDLST